MTTLLSAFLPSATVWLERVDERRFCFSSKRDRLASMRLLIVSIFLSQLVAQEDFGDLYDLLGLSEEANDRDIKTAYRRLSLIHHPDKGGSTARFKEITTAYEVLSDGEKRSMYDVGGMSAVNQGGSGRTDPWGRPIGVPRGENVQVTVNVFLKDMYVGGQVRAKVRRRVVCRGCSAANRSPSQKCAACGPTCPATTKIVQRRMGMMRVNQEVEEASDERCKEEVVQLNATIERGMPNNENIVFERASEQSPGKVPGNVLLTLATRPHAVFSRSGNDLHMKLKIPLSEGLLGFERKVLVVAQGGGGAQGGSLDVWTDRRWWWTYRRRGWLGKEGSVPC